MGQRLIQVPRPLGEAEELIGDRSEDAEAKANKHRRRIQNRKNQRAHRLRLKGKDAGAGQRLRPFQIGRWRLDEHDVVFPEEASPALGGASTTPISPRSLHTHIESCSPTTEHTTSPRESRLTAPHRPSSTPDPQPFTFPLSSDHLIRHEGLFDRWELMYDLIGDLMLSTPAACVGGITPAATQRPPPLLTPPSPSGSIDGVDDDEVTAGRKGSIVWGEPHETQSWEATPGFLAKWAWAVEGCGELVETSNRWRMRRGEEPMRLSL